MRKSGLLLAGVMLGMVLTIGLLWLGPMRSSQAATAGPGMQVDGSAVWRLTDEGSLTDGSMAVAESDELPPAGDGVRSQA